MSTLTLEETRGLAGRGILKSRPWHIEGDSATATS